MLILTDVHVHIYHCFDLEKFFSAAFDNFKNEAHKKGCKEDFAATLFLTDWAKQDWFGYLADLADAGTPVGEWGVSHTAEDTSLRISRPDGEGFWIIAGRKIITRENLELLGLFTEAFFDDGDSLENLIGSVRKSGAVPVIPWAAGKWMGYRGTVVANAIKKASPSDFFLSDNGNRPVFWRRPALFSLADSKKIRVLSGSDPLHFASEVYRVGSFGCSFQGEISQTCPGDSLKKILLAPDLEIRMYGELERPCRFFRNQATMQIKKKTWRKELADL